MQVFANQSLKKFNTFGIDVQAKKMLKVTDESMLQSAIQLVDSPKMILGGGSNILLTKDMEGLLIKNEIKGISIAKETSKNVIIAAGGGVVWHQLVEWCIAHDLGGIENLSLIPGTVGAAPIQNIGAYGVELENVFYQLEAIDLETGKKLIFDKKDCQFEYRNSIFKNSIKGKYCITKVCLQLTKKKHKLHLDYGAIRSTLATMKIENITIQAISEVVIKIRKEKLPYPSKIGNAGSFFKNPALNKANIERLQKKYPQIVYYPIDDEKVKVPAGWLIEHCGWKGKRIGQTGTHSQQALVIVNYGNATGNQIRQLAEKIIYSVKNAFDIVLKPEVNIW